MLSKIQFCRNPGFPSLITLGGISYLLKYVFHMLASNLTTSFNKNTSNHFNKSHKDCQCAVSSHDADLNIFHDRDPRCYPVKYVQYVCGNGRWLITSGC